MPLTETIRVSEDGDDWTVSYSSAVRYGGKHPHRIEVFCASDGDSSQSDLTADDAREFATALIKAANACDATDRLEGNYRS